MIKTITTAILSFAGTNIDDIFILALLFGIAKTKREKINITAGQFIGIYLTVAISILGGLVAGLIPEKYVGLLGVIPIIIGITEIIENVRGEYDDKEYRKIGVFSVALITLANGGDNVGVYIPLFAMYNIKEIIITIIVYAICIFVLCFIADKIGTIPKIESFFKRFQHIIVPTVLIGLGIYILLESFLFKT